MSESDRKAVMLTALDIETIYAALQAVWEAETDDTAHDKLTNGSPFYVVGNFSVNDLIERFGAIRKDWTA